MKKISLVTTLLLMTLGTVSEASETTKVLETINVDSKSDSQRDDLDLSSPTNLYQVEKSAQFATEVINEKEIEAYKPKDFFDLLNKAIGLDVTYQGRKHPYFINMRGGGNITYILDGAILPPTSDRILVKLPMSAIEEIQIVRTSTALTLAPSIDIGASNSGSGTNIGFIVIRTKQPKKTQGVISTFLEQAVDQPSANGQNVYLGTRFGDTSSLNGYIGGMVSRFERPSKDDWFDGSNAKSVMINGGLNFGKVTLNLMGYKDSGRFEMQRGVGVDGTINTSKWYYEPIKTSIVSLDGNILWNENQVTLFAAAKIDYSQDEYNAYFDKTTFAHKFYSESTHTYSLRHHARFGNTMLRLGMQMSNSKGFGPNLSKSYNKFDTTVTGYAASLEQTLFDGSLVLDAGYRRDVKHIDNSTTGGGKGSSATTPHPDANNNVDLAPANVIAAGVMFKPNNTYTLNLRYYRGDEGTSGDFDLMTQDGSALHAEKQNRWEAGFSAAYGTYFHPMVTYFDVDIKNEKTATSNTYTDSEGNEYYYYTEQNSHRKGLEVSVKGVIQKNTSYKFSWTSMLANETSSNGTTTDSVGVSTPKNIYSALLSHTWEDYRFNVSAKRADPYSSSTSAMGVSTDVNLGDYTRIDANIMKDFKFKHYVITGKLYGRNLTNDHYATRYTTGYYYDRGRTIGGEVSFAF